MVGEAAGRRIYGGVVVILDISIALAVAAVWYGVVWYFRGYRLTPDGKHYTAMSAGDSAPLPFSLRWFVPFCVGPRPRVWTVVSGVALLASVGLLTAWLHARGIEPAWFGGVLFVGLSGVFWYNVAWPVLVDQVATASVIGTVLLYDLGFVWWAVALCVVGAMVKESVPLWAAAAVVSPLLLAGLVAPAVRVLFCSRSDGIVNSLKQARSRQGPRMVDARLMLLPWGVCLVGLVSGEPAVLLSAALGYALLLVVNDTVRIYQMAFLPIIAATVAAVPAEWVVPLAVAHVFNPWRGEYEVSHG